MNNENKSKNEPKKNIPGGFLIFILAAILIMLTVQNLNHEKTAKVAFSHQVEHLANLDLLQKDENRKIALNDNLVTFSGKFRDRKTDEAAARYKYLELLSHNHELIADKARLAGEISLLKQNVKESADWFLHLSGLPIPRSGYKVIDPVYNSADAENEIVIRKLSEKDVTSLADLNQRFATETPSLFGKDLVTLIQGFRSPALGIGNETIKQQLKTLEQTVADSAGLSLEEQKSVQKNALAELALIVDELNQDNQNMRLLALRSVRNYKAELAQYTAVSDELETNEAQLDKARQAVSQAIWFFNNQELSTRALEKQDPEAFNHWFASAKQEWENFSYNKAAAFKAPDQPRNTVLEKNLPERNWMSACSKFFPPLWLIMG